MHTSESTPSNPSSTGCVRAVERFVDTLHHRDWSALRELFDEDQTWEDRRSGLGVQLGGRDAYVSMARMTFEELGFTNTTLEVIATRGERLGLFRSVVSDADGNEIELLALNEIDEHGLFANGSVYFDVTDLEAAIKELDERFACR